MKIFMTISFAFIFFSNSKLFSQSDYYPSKPEGTSENDYRNGRLMLENAYSQMKRDSGKVFAHDYWNIAIAYQTMGQSSQEIYDYLLKAKMQNVADFCMIANANNAHKGGIENTSLFRLLGPSYSILLEGCDSSFQTDDGISCTDYARKNGFDVNLVCKLEEIKKLDQKFRSTFYQPDLQDPIDKQNMKEIEDIIVKHGYPGKSIVGNKYESTAWLVIQHSTLAFQEKYLPIIADAVMNGELGKTPLKMLIDRIYYSKIGYQIFGSQIGVSFADDKILMEVKAKYGLK